MIQNKITYLRNTTYITKVFTYNDSQKMIENNYNACYIINKSNKYSKELMIKLLVLTIPI